MRGRSLLSIHDLSVAEVEKIFEVSARLKEETRAGVEHHLLRGKTLAMIFTKPSTRTRVSFEVAIWQLGGYGLFLSAQELQLRRGETIADTARVLSRYVDGIMIRTFDHRDVEDLARYGTVPVINGLTDLLHPCQALADYFTVFEKKGRTKGLKLVYVGDGNNVAHSLMLGGAKVGIDVTVACPPGYEPLQDIVEMAGEDAKATGATIRVTHDPVEAVKGADVIYTDVWASMGQEAEHEKKARALAAFQVNEALVEAAGKEDVMVMHCLPAHRGEEITDGVMDGPHSVVFDEAENRLHVQKAILVLLMQGRKAGESGL
ncbi:MAG: ornithine carbamoyltransferase [Firmicutes bacterium]|nr:ornithine carbamoyltransferase [Bacillota bacterium]MDH7495124.1 ornithine carbamoyltransferase [Bacillota bacterium]